MNQSYMKRICRLYIYGHVHSSYSSFNFLDTNTNSVTYLHVSFFIVITLLVCFSLSSSSFVKFDNTILGSTTICMLC